MDKPTRYIPAYWDNELVKIPCWSSQEEIDGFLNREVKFYSFDMPERPVYKYPSAVITFDRENIHDRFRNYLRGHISFEYGYDHDGERPEVVIYIMCDWNRKAECSASKSNLLKNIYCIVNEEKITKEEYERALLEPRPW